MFQRKEKEKNVCYEKVENMVIYRTLSFMKIKNRKHTSNNTYLRPLIFHILMSTSKYIMN